MLVLQHSTDLPIKHPLPQLKGIDCSVTVDQSNGAPGLNKRRSRLRFTNSPTPLVVPLAETGRAASTTTTLKTSPTSANYGAGVLLTATVVSGEKPVTQGAVSFLNGSTLIGSGTLGNDGSAAITTTTLPIGADSLTASYAAGAAFAASSSTPIIVTIIPAPIPDFAIATAPLVLTVSGGQTATTTITVTPSNGFNEALNLSCAGLPPGASCSFATPVVQTDGTSSIVTSISTQKLTAARMPNSLFSSPFFAVLPLVSIVLYRRRKRLTTRIYLAFMTLLLLVWSSALTGCGGGGGSQTPNPTPTPITSTVTITAQTQGGLSHAIQLTLTVN